MRTAAGIIIGDEFLSGRMRDKNVHLLIDMLRSAGISLRRIVTLRDDINDISHEVLWCSENYQHVFTSGGLGPTENDHTIAGIALAFGCSVVRDPFLEVQVRRHFTPYCNEASLKLADLPEGARLIMSGESFFPTILFKNVYILPGVSQLFAAKLEHIRKEFLQPTTESNV